jgi:pimeloyl-ACP methyl ester carboxylesterase
MTIELVRITTDDQLWLDGAWYRSTSPLPATSPVDACLLLHGTGSNFLAPGVLDSFAQQARATGLSVLRLNTRGHDGICSIAGPKWSIRGGATYEHVADCVLDVHAALGFLRAEGCSRIALVGHSMGGVKSVYTMAHRPHPAVRAVVMVSSPRFNHAWYMSHPLADPFRDAFRRAQLAVVAGRPEELIPMTQPMSFLATAEGILDKYGPADNYDWSGLLPSITCPVLYILGSDSPGQSIGFAGVPEILADLKMQLPNLKFSLVEGANINYSGQHEVPFQRAWEWLQKIT